MALNIAITSKYNPFTYEDYIKPLEGYWEDYEKHEAALDQLGTDVATLRPIIENMGEGEEKTKYTNWLNNLEQQAGNLQSNGLTAENRKALRELKTSYASLMPRLALAEESRRKAAAEWMAERNSGKYFTDDNLPQELQNVNNFLDGNIPYYSRGLSKDDVSKEAMSAAKAFSSRVFTNPTITKDTQAGVDFIKQVEERGYNANIEDIQNDEFLSQILESLYSKYGVDKNATDARSRSIRDHIAREFWKGLVYEKQTNYQQYKPGKPESPYSVVAHYDNGNRLVRSGNRHFILDKDGRLIGEYEKPDPDNKPPKPPTATEVKQTNFFSQHTIGYDQYLNNNLDKVLKPGDPLDTQYSSPMQVLTKAKKSLINTSWWDNEEFTRVSGIDPGIAYEKSDGITDDDGTLKNFTPDNTVFFEIGGGSRRRFNPDLKGELFGDNHIVGVDISAVLSMLDIGTSEDLKLLNNVYKQYKKFLNSKVAEKIIEHITKKVKAGILTKEGLLRNCPDIAPIFESFFASKDGTPETQNEEKNKGKQSNNGTPNPLEME